jgi:two-component system C4-dicarboxylate transport response regulator DctD
VLIVDDEPSIRLLCRINLELEGYRAVEAASLAEARKVLTDETVDVILCDLHLEDGDGRELIEELRVAAPHLPVALLTGTVDLTPLERSAVDAVLEKPFRLDQLLDTVRKLESR